MVQIDGNLLLVHTCVVLPLMTMLRVNRQVKGLRYAHTA